MAACKSGQQNGNTPKEYLSVADFSSDDIIVMGTYDELIAKMGEPEHCSDSGCVAKCNDTSVYIPVMYYPGIWYIRKSDSVQLFFVDFRKSGVKLTMQTGGGEPLTLDSNSLCDDFYAYMDQFVFADGNSSTLPDEERMSFDVHYMTDGIYYVLGYPCDAIDKRHGNVIRPVFTPDDKRLWYIEFGAVDMGGLYRNNK
ncbi:MAG: hypothetical protein IKQ53_08935 [Bacteroidales bacterium]|nr:hypothetical protein [Bacteroidales bacterium]